MKKYCLLLISLISIIQSGDCQTTENVGAIKQKISIKEYQGKTIELSAALKVKQIENNSGAVLFYKIQKTNKEAGSAAVTKTPVTTKEWTLCLLNFKIDADADSLNFGVLFQGKAMYYIDCIALTIDGKKITIGDGDFEDNSRFPNENWATPILPADYLISYTNEMSYSGNHALVVDGSNGEKINKIGNNDSTGNFVTINGATLYYEIYGNGEPLLLLHGNQQSIEVFKEQVIEFSKFYKVIAIDTRGQGKSTIEDKTYSYDLFAADMNLLLDYLKIENANIVGWSDGGNTGLIMAMKYPAKVKKLVTMGACVFIDNTVVDKTVFKEVEKRIAELKRDTTVKQQNSQRLYTMLLTEPRHSFEELKFISCPVLVIAGEQDIIKPGHTKGIAAHIANSKILIAAKETHEYPVENPKSFNEVVLNFLKN